MRTFLDFSSLNLGPASVLNGQLKRKRADKRRPQGKLFDSTIADEGTWTLEDRKMVRIVLTKTKRDAANCWTSLLESDYAADPWVQDQMQRKLTLERFQKENPGFDFSGAEISGNYTKGGPDFSNLEK
ncbi:nudC domain-containing protein 2 isoform X2 [Odocoileus virginianus]|uniref:NudC domain-containing protein 2 isoform X2 n=1 Tax=Odocoileus virginianus TaxID=9874 RepID=A0A6J0Y7B8_ODOVR|nr:nudC domain-containing protein 2 isoform X2 [Odocoileus virginianus texanus]